jgi:hypothetical protein
MLKTSQVELLIEPFYSNPAVAKARARPSGAGSLTFGNSGERRMVNGHGEETGFQSGLESELIRSNPA